MKPFPLVAAAALTVYLVLKRRTIERAILVVGALVLAGLLVYGLGVVHPPSLEHTLLSVGEHLGKWTYVLVGALAFLETGAFVGLVAPGETAILLGGVVAGQGKIDVVTLIAIVWCCAVAGDLTSFALGRRLGRTFMERHGPKVKITEERLRQVEGFFDRHGGRAILLGRFVGLVRAIAPFLAGASRMPLRRFVPYDVVGAGLWGSAFVLLGFTFWHSLDQVLAIAKRGALGLSAAILLGVAIAAGVRGLKEPANRERVRAWLGRQAQRPLVAPVVRALAPVARRVPRGETGLEIITLVALALVGAYVFGAYAYILRTLDTTVGDMRAIDLAQSLRSGVAVDLVKVVTWLGALPVAGGLVLVTSAVLVSRRRVREALALSAGMALTVAAVQIAKAAIDRPRPADPLVGTEGSSYPSGHTAYAVAWVAVAIVLGRALPGVGGRVAGVGAGVTVLIVVGLSRVYLGAHYLSDVLGGAGLGVALFALCGLAALIVGRVRNNSRAL